MRPIFIRFADLSYIHSGHFMLFLGGLAAIILVSIETRRVRERPEKIYGLLVLLMISAVYGAHALYWLDFRENYNYGIKHLFIFWKGGMALYGGGALALATYVLYTHWQKLDFWGTGDLLAPPTFLFVFCARIGCFLTGCCYGKQCSADFPLALTFTDPVAMAPKNTPLYPTQLFYVASALIIFVILWARRKRKAFEGEIGLIGTILYLVTSFVIEFFRADLRVLYDIHGAILSQNQVLSISFFLLTIILYFHRRAEARAGRLGTQP
jgi:phosphatidylglycerol---prolipoprotein diacylglyceryl transferase